MSSKYSVTKGNEYVTMLKSIASSGERAVPLWASTIVCFLDCGALRDAQSVQRCVRSLNCSLQPRVAAVSGDCGRAQVQFHVLCYRNVCLQLRLTSWMAGAVVPGRCSLRFHCLKVHRRRAKQCGMKQPELGTLFVLFPRTSSWLLRKLGATLRCRLSLTTFLSRGGAQWGKLPWAAGWVLSFTATRLPEIGWGDLLVLMARPLVEKGACGKATITIFMSRASARKHF